MKITCRYLVLAIAAIAIVLVTATGAAMGAAQIVNASTAPATVDGAAASSGSSPWPAYLAGGLVIVILAVGILYIFRERSGK